MRAGSIRKATLSHVYLKQVRVLVLSEQRRSSIPYTDGIPSQHFRFYQKKMQELAYICAVSASNLNAANIVRKELGPMYLPKHAMDIHHAWMLQNEGKYQEALDTLVPEGWRTRKQRKVGTTMQAMLYSETKQWSQSWYVAASPFVDIQAKITIAHRLKDNGFAYEARELFDHACPMLENPEIWGCGTVMKIPKRK